MSALPGTLGVLTALDVPTPMRDGVVLRANVFRPDGPGRFPALVLRTPYGKPAAGYEAFVRAGYVVVAQDFRGRYASDGDYVPFSEPHTGDAEDGYDTVEWAAAQPWCNGVVGTFGASYCSWAQWQLARLRPPHLRAMCAYSVPVDLTPLDWPGVFRPGRRVHWWMTHMAPDLRRRAGLPPPHTPAEARRIWHELEHGRWLGLLPWRDLPRHLPPPLAGYVDAWLRDPGREPWDFAAAHHQITVPNLDISGWFDHCNDSMRHLAGMQAHGRTARAREQSRLVIGPWNHVGLGQRRCGNFDFGPAAELNLNALLIQWFDHWLKGLPNGVTAAPAVRYFVLGRGVWREATMWPPPELTPQRFFLACGGDAAAPRRAGALRPTPPARAICDRYVYDPVDPVPTLWTPELFMGASDRRALEHRADILYYRSAPLAADLEIAGYPEVVLHAASSAPDTDWFAVLVDEPPDGPALAVCQGMVRARYRHGLARAELLTPNEVTEFVIRLGATACCFQRGHRLRLEITSSDFPNYDRNHNTGGDDLAEVELRPATQQIWHGRAHPSRLILPVCATAN